MIASKEERMYRAVAIQGKMRWDKDDTLEVVVRNGAKGEELKAVKKMARLARDGPESCLTKDSVRRKRSRRAHEGDCDCSAA